MQEIAKKSRIAKILKKNKEFCFKDCNDLTRREKLTLLKRIYLAYLSEDWFDGTTYDNIILDGFDSMFKELERLEPTPKPIEKEKPRKLSNEGIINTIIKMIKGE